MPYPLSVFMAGSPGAGTTERSKILIEILERNIPKSAFINIFLEAHETVSRPRKEFGGEVVIILIRRNFEKDALETVAPVVIEPVGKKIDDYISKRYAKDELENLS